MKYKMTPERADAMIESASILLNEIKCKCHQMSRGEKWKDVYRLLCDSTESMAKARDGLVVLRRKRKAKNG